MGLIIVVVESCFHAQKSEFGRIGIEKMLPTAHDAVGSGYKNQLAFTR